MRASQPLRRDRLHRNIANRRAETVGHGMAVDDQHAHQNASIFAATFVMNVFRVFSVERFIE